MKGYHAGNSKAALFCTFILCLHISAAHSQSTLSPIVRGGDSVPGVADVMFNSPSPVHVDNRGTITFYAQYVRDGTILNQNGGYWKWDSQSGLRPVAQVGTAGPVGAGSYDLLNLWDVSPNGRILFSSRTAADRSLQHAWSGFESSDISLLITEGDPTPVAGFDAVIEKFRTRALSRSGRAMFTAELAGPSIDPERNRAMFSENSAGDLRMLLREGEQAPGEAEGVILEDLPSVPLQEGDDGFHVVTGTVSGNFITTAQDSRIWGLRESGDLVWALREGEQAAGLPAGLEYDVLIVNSVNIHGTALVLGGLRGVGVTSNDRAARWLVHPDGQQILVFRNGTPPAGIGTPDDTLVLLDGHISDGGHLTFNGTLLPAAQPGTILNGLWRVEPDGQFVQLALVGDRAPGTPEGVVFARYEPAGEWYEGYTNARGQTIFAAGLTGPGVTSSNDSGLWASDRHGQVWLVFREGDKIDVSPTPGVFDLRPIALWGFTPLNDNGEAGVVLLYPGLGVMYLMQVGPLCRADIADDLGTIGADGQISFGDFLALLGLVGPCPGGTPGCTGDIANDFGTLGGDGQVSFGDFLALLGLVGPCP